MTSFEGHASESSRIRDYVLPLCVGDGLDVGCGCEKISPNAIGIDYEKQYNIPDHPLTAADFIGDWQEFFYAYPTSRFDFIYSSHYVEDLEDPYAEALIPWVDHLLPGGRIILVLPIEDEYQKHGVNCNTRHKHNWKGPDDFIAIAPKEFLDRMRVECVSTEPIGLYSMYIVFQLKEE